MRKLLKPPQLAVDHNKLPFFPWELPQLLRQPPNLLPLSNPNSGPKETIPDGGKVF